jgi:hypothetical protein
MIKNHRYQSKTVVPGSSISPRRDEVLFVGQDIVKSQIAIRRAYGVVFSCLAPGVSKGLLPSRGLVGPGRTG